MTQSHSRIVFPVESLDSTGNKSDIIQNEFKTVLFGHHPCPDGISALVLLQEKFGTTNATYVGFNHAKPDDMRKTIYSYISDHPINIVFADITPPFNILRELLDHTNCTITILDHHETAIKEINMNLEYLSKFGARLQIILDMNLSGVSIAYNYTHNRLDSTAKYPPCVSLVQAMDRFTATSDINILKEFDAKAINLDEPAKKLMEYLSSLTSNQQIKNNIEFYVLAGMLDDQLKQFYKQSNSKVDDILMKLVKQYFDYIEKFGFTSLLKENEKKLQIEFKAQLDYQAHAIDNAVIIPSGISDKFDVLFVEANIQTGRTFDALIEDKLKKLPRPAIAIIADTKNISENNNWASLRTAVTEFNLSQIAFEYKDTGKALNAGGHSRASALQLSKEQLLVFKHQSDSIKKIHMSTLTKLGLLSDKSEVNLNAKKSVTLVESVGLSSFQNLKYKT